MIKEAQQAGMEQALAELGMDKEAYIAGQEAAMEKIAITIDPGMLGMLAGVTSGYSLGRDAAGSTANVLSSKGSKTKNESIARTLAAVGAPIGAIGGIALGRKHAPKLNKLLSKVSDDAKVQMLLRGALPFGTGVAGGAAAGSGIGALTSLRGQK